MITRWLSSILLACVLFFSLGAEARAEDSVGIRGTLVAITISPAPLTRVRVNLDNSATGEHREVEWDPARSSPLTQVVRLKNDATRSAALLVKDNEAAKSAQEAAKAKGEETPARDVHGEKVTRDLGRWSATMWAEPIVLTAGNSAHFLYTSFALHHAEWAPILDDDAKPAPAGAPPKAAAVDHGQKLSLDTPALWSWSFEGTMQNGLPQPKGESTVGESAPHHTVKITFSTDVEQSTAVQGKESSVIAPLSLNGRSAAVVPDAVAELLQIFAEIAADKAKSKAFEVVSDLVREAVCDTLVWSPPMRQALHLRAGKTPDDGTALLPRTCEAAKHLRLEELASSAKAIASDLVADLAELGVRELEPAIERALLTALRPELTRLVHDLDTRAVTYPRFGAAVKQLRATLDRQGSLPEVLADIEKLLFLAVDGQLMVQDLAAVARDLGPGTIGSARGHAAAAWRPLAVALRRLFHSPTLADGLDLGSTKALIQALEAADATPASIGVALDAAATASAALITPGSAAATRLDALKASLARNIEDVSLDDTLLAFLQTLTTTVSFPSVGTAAQQKELEALAGEVLREKGLKLGMIAAHWKGLEGLLSDHPAFHDSLSGAYKEVGFLDPVMRKLVTTLIDAATGKVTSERAGQLVFAQLSSTRWAKGLCPTGASTEACEWACGVDAGFALLGSCLDRAGGCTATELGAMVSTIEEHLEGDGTCKGVIEHLGDTWPGLGTTVLHGLSILRPSADATPRSIALHATDLLFDLLEKRYCSSNSAQICGDLKDLRTILRGIMEEKTPTVLVAASSLLERALDQAIDDGTVGKSKTTLLKITHVAGALTAYAATYTSDPKGDPEALKEAHESRKKAIEGLIDATTDRTHRDGELVFSLGVNAGFGLSGFQSRENRASSAGTTGSQAEYMPPQLQLPMGIAMDRLPDLRNTKSKFGGGYHLQVSVIDLGQFLAVSKDATVSKPRWDSFLMVGLQYGVIVGSPSNAFMLGIDARWSPTLFAQDGDAQTKGVGALRAGLFASYYVPFFDFN